jgi:hypothetical protein
MRTRGIAGLAAALTMALPMAGCGGDDDSNRDAAYKPPAGQTTAADANPAEAKAAAREAATYVESCYADTQDYSQCKSGDVLAAGDLEVGSSPGQVRVAEATASTYRIEARSQGDGVFTIEKDESGAVERTCSGAGCEGGSW